MILGISEEIVKSLNLSLEDIKYDEQRKVILSSSDIVSMLKMLMEVSLRTG